MRSTLELVIARGGDFFEPVEPPPDGDITFAETKALAAERMTLGGNVEARIIANGSVEEVEGATWRAFEGGLERMVLKLSEGPLDALTSQMAVNYHRVVDLSSALVSFRRSLSECLCDVLRRTKEGQPLAHWPS